MNIHAVRRALIRDMSTCEAELNFVLQEIGYAVCKGTIGCRGRGWGHYYAAPDPLVERLREAQRGLD